MEEEYDVIVLGTGLKECILSGLLSTDGLKVLHMDRNDYYGGESASLNLVQLWRKFRDNSSPPTNCGPSKNYNVDMKPKFMMANGLLVATLIHTGVTDYLQFKPVDGSYVLLKGSIHKVPCNAREAGSSKLMGLIEKFRAKSFFNHIQDINKANPQGLDKITSKQLFAKHGLSDDTIGFIGHALALHQDDSYLNRAALETVERINLYASSMLRYGGNSPYIYPMYGLGELPQAFARLGAIHGATYMLRKPGCTVEFDEAGRVRGVTSDGETARAKVVVCDPSYVKDKVKKVGQVVRAICIMSHPIPGTDGSAQIILPQRQTGRKSDMYMFCCSAEHGVAPKGKYIAFISAEVETGSPIDELTPGLNLLGGWDEKFIDIYDILEPVTDGSSDKCFISKSYDATTHFESTVKDVLSMYTRITGKVLNF